MREKEVVMWRGKGGISISHSCVGEGELAQDWHAEILMPRAVNIHACLSPIVKMWRTKAVSQSVGLSCTFLLISKDKGL